MNGLGNGPWDKGYEPSGTSKAQEAAQKAFPGQMFIHDRCLFRMGYEQAEKDIALTIKDLELLHVFLYAVKNNKQGVFTFTRLSDEQYQEVLKRFKEARK